MRKYTFLAAAVLLVQHGTAQDTWTQKADFGGDQRGFATGFSIGTKGYIGLGTPGVSPVKDFWEYDPDTDIWTQKADFGGGETEYATGFSIGTKGYIGTGADANTVAKKDFWEYDPSANTWTQKADFGGTARYYATGFSIGTKGYIGTGPENGGASYVKDFWEYDPSANKWIQKADFGGTPRASATGFSIGAKGYIGTGFEGGGGPYTKDFWEFDPSANTWTQKADFGGAARYAAVGFSIGTKGYIGTGGGANAFSSLAEFWEYDPGTNIWSQKADFVTSTKYDVGFSIGTYGYIGSNPYFSQYAPAVLPLVLINFTIQKENSGVKLLWQTPTEQNMSQFIIERSADGVRFSSLGKTIASGNSSSIKSYFFTDAQPLKGANFYKLKMVDTDGKFTYSNIVAVKIGEKNISFQIFPNPAENILFVQAYGENENATVQIIDATGKKLKEQKVPLNGNTSFSFSINNLPKGMYHLLLRKKNKTELRKFIKE